MLNNQVTNLKIAVMKLLQKNKISYNILRETYVVECHDKIDPMDHVHARLYFGHSDEECHPFAVMDEAFSDEDSRCSAIKDIKLFSRHLI